MEFHKGEWYDAVHNGKWIIILLIKINLRRFFWEAHSNGDSFHVQKKQPIKASVSSQRNEIINCISCIEEKGSKKVS